MKDAGSYSKKLVDDLLDQITGGDHSRMLFRLRQVGAGFTCEVMGLFSPRVDFSHYFPGKPWKGALIWHLLFTPLRPARLPQLSPSIVLKNVLLP